MKEEMNSEQRDGKQRDLLFDVRRSIRYHRRRQAFFDRADRVVNAISIVFGSAAVYGALAEHPLVVMIAAVSVTVASSFNLVWGTALKARDHSDLARRFNYLEKRLIRPQLSEMDLCDITDARLSIEADEPPVMRVLDVLCWNEEVRARDHWNAKQAKVSWWQCFLAQIVDWRPDSIRSPYQNEETPAGQS